MIVLGFVGGFLLSDCSSQKDYDLLLSQANSTIDELSITKNKVQSLNKIIGGQDEEAQTLREIITSYENRPAEIDYRFLNFRF